MFKQKKTLIYKLILSFKNKILLPKKYFLSHKPSVYLLDLVYRYPISLASIG